MATLKNLTINDTGHVTFPAGTLVQRSGVTINSGIPTGANFGQLRAAHNGLPLTINGTGQAWANWQNLPTYLTGLSGTSSINDTQAGSWTFSNSTLVYLLRNSGWDPVDLTGYTLFESNRDYISAANVDVYTRTYAAGTYAFDNYSAMYLFSIPTLAGTIRYNSTLSLFEGYTGTIWTPLQTLNRGTTTVYTSTPGPGVHPIPSGTTHVNALIVAGGGGGGLCMGGGGGGGGVRFISNIPVNPGGTVPVGVGAGGAGGASRGGNAPRGGNSNFGLYTSTGGGGGGNWDGGGGGPGGSGGGGVQPGPSAGAGNSPAVTPPQGFNGGTSGGSFGSYQAGGGGGGAGTAGFPGYPGGGGSGGSGVNYATIGDGRGTSSNSQTTGWYGGGGGGGIQDASTRWGFGRDGGQPGRSGGPPGLSAGANTGAGGGGQGHPPDAPGGAGGSGIVIIQHLSPQAV